VKDTSNWPVVILCGGKGTRMWPLTEEVPKPLIRIGDRAILWHLMKRYSTFGHKNFILCLGHMKEKIVEYFSQPENKEDWNINFIDTGLNSLKAERVIKIKDLIITDNFFLSFADDLSSVNIPDLVNFHLDKQKIITLTSVPLYSQFGVLEINNGYEVHSFKEKPRINEYWINGGFYVCNKKLFDFLHLGELEGEVLSNLASKKEVAAFKFEGFWKCMNTSKEAIEFNKLFDSQETPWKNW